MKLTAKCFYFVIVAASVMLAIAHAQPAKKKAQIPKDNSPRVSQDYKGRVLDESNKPVTGALVKYTGNDAGTITDKDGNFTVTARPGDTLYISMGAYSPLKLVLTSSTVLNTVLYRENNTISVDPARPVQLIYTTSPANLTAASNDIVYNKDLIKYPVTSYRNALTGRLAGLYNLQSSGFPGGDGAAFSLRGQTPVILIDGVFANLTIMDLEEIESITVLKDAVATAMLGVRGSQGAIVVTTKKGKQDKQQVSFTAQTAIQKPFGYPKSVGAYDYVRLYNEGLKNDGLAPLYTDADLLGYQNHTDPYRYPDVNWREQITNKTSVFNRYSLNVTGGNKFARYYVALEHVNQSGFFKTVDSNSYNTNNNFKSYVIRSNVDINITSKLTAGIYLFGRILNANEPGVTTGSILTNLANTPANAYPALNPNGTFGGTQQFQSNILAQTIGSGYRQNYQRDVLVNLYLKRAMDDVIPGLWMQAKIAYYSNLSENVVRSKSFAVFLQNGTTTPATYTQYGTNGTQSNSNGIDFQGRTDYEEFSIGYDKTIKGKHGIHALVLGNRDNSSTGSDLPYTITGTSGRVSYDYKGKYVIEGVFGMNGSNRYPNNGRTKLGFFPAAGLSWNMEKEKFLQGAGWLNHLKLYGSYGRTGRDNAGYFTYIQRFFDASTVYFGTGASGNTTITEQPLADSNITFEKANKMNIGINGAVINNHLSFNVEYFRNKYFDLRMQRGRNTALLGNDYPDENIGRNRYSGWEAQLAWQHAGKSFQYFAAANFSLLKSEVLFVDEVFRQYDWMKRTGRPVGQLFGYVSDGLYQSQAQINSSATIDGYTPQPGDIKYKDLNADGIINQFDVAAIGNTKPLITYGISLGVSYKGFDFSALIQGVQNRTIYLSGSSYWAFQNGGFGQAYTNNLNRWTPETAATATYPRLNIGVNNNNQATSSFWVHSGNYLRLKNAEIGYSLPASLIGKIKLQSVRIFINGYNLLTASDSSLDGLDPEVYNNNYPLQRLYNFGINIKF